MEEINNEEVEKQLMIEPRSYPACDYCQNNEDITTFNELVTKENIIGDEIKGWRELKGEILSVCEGCPYHKAYREKQSQEEELRKELENRILFIFAGNFRRVEGGYRIKGREELGIIRFEKDPAGVLHAQIDGLRPRFVADQADPYKIYIQPHAGESTEFTESFGAGLRTQLGCLIIKVFSERSSGQANNRRPNILAKPAKDARLFFDAREWYNTRDAQQRE